MSGIFISYRRGSAASAYAGRLHDRLAARFGEDRVFMDVSTLEPGVDFVQVVETAVKSCEALLAVIDPDWVELRSPDGRRRLDDENDLVRIEVVTALSRRVKVVPVLVNGAVMPLEHELPEPLAALARRNAAVLTHERWDTDIEPLLTALENLLRSSGDTGPPATGLPRQPAASRKPMGGAVRGVRESADGLRYIEIDSRETLVAASRVAPVLAVYFGRSAGVAEVLWGYNSGRRTIFERSVLPELAEQLRGTRVQPAMVMKPVLDTVAGETSSPGSAFSMWMYQGGTLIARRELSVSTFKNARKKQRVLLDAIRGALPELIGSLPEPDRSDPGGSGKPERSGGE